MAPRSAPPASHSRSNSRHAPRDDLSTVSEATTESTISSVVPSTVDSDSTVNTPPRRRVRRPKPSVKPKPSRFKPPTLRFRSRQNSMSRDGPFDLTPLSHSYTADDTAFESEPDFRWSSSNLSLSTTATSVDSDEGSDCIPTAPAHTETNTQPEPPRNQLTIHIDTRPQTVANAQKAVTTALAPTRRPPSPPRKDIQNIKTFEALNKTREKLSALELEFENLKRENAELIDTRDDLSNQLCEHKRIAHDVNCELQEQALKFKNFEEDSRGELDRSSEAHRNGMQKLQFNHQKEIDEIHHEHERYVQDLNVEYQKEIEKARKERAEKEQQLEEERKELEMDLAKHKEDHQATWDILDAERKQHVDAFNEERIKHTEALEEERIKYTRSLEEEGIKYSEALEAERTELTKSLEAAHNEHKEAQEKSEATIKDLRDQVDRFREYNAVLEDKCSSLEEIIEKQRNQASNLEAKSINLERELSDVLSIHKSQTAAYTARVAGLEIARDALQFKLEGLEAEMLKKTNEFLVDVETFKVETERAQARFEDADRERFQLLETKGALERLFERNTAAKDACIADKEAEIRELSFRISALDNDKASITEHVHDLEGEREELERRVDHLRDETESLRDQVHTLLSDQDEQSSRVLRLAVENSSLRSRSAAPSAVGIPTSERGDNEEEAEPVIEVIIEEDEAPAPEPAPPASSQVAPDQVPVDRGIEGDLAEPEPAVDPFQAEHEALVSQLRQDIITLGARNAELSEKAAAVDGLRTAHDELQARLAVAEGNSNSNSNSDSALVDALRAENNGLTLQLQGLQYHLDAATKAQHEANDKVTALTAKVAALKAQLAGMPPRQGSNGKKHGNLKRKDAEVVIVRDPNNRNAV